MSPNNSYGNIDEMEQNYATKKNKNFEFRHGIGYVLKCIAIRCTEIGFQMSKEAKHSSFLYKFQGTIFRQYNALVHELPTFKDILQENE